MRTTRRTKRRSKILGQAKHGSLEAPPTDYHAVHTFRGISGATPGFSCQNDESVECFKKALIDVLPISARAACRFLFSDNPRPLLSVAFEILPNLSAIGEDPAHLVFRIEECFGNKRNRLSRRLLSLQRKFHPAHPAHHVMYRGDSKSAVITPWDIDLVNVATGIYNIRRRSARWRAGFNFPYSVNR